MPIWAILGRKPISYSWLVFVLPALMLNYMGQGAMILSMTPAEAQVAIRDPFFLMVPDIISTPVIFLTILAAIIASQAVISGAFSLTQQAIQLGFMPRMTIQHTSEKAAGQIYIPAINWGLAIMVLLLVLFFQSSSNLAAAYGIAVTGAMFIDTCLISVVLLTLWKWPKWKAPACARHFLCRRFCLFRRQSTESAVGWLGAAGDWPSHFHAADDMGAWPRADARKNGRKHDADGDFHQICSW